jgi:hypothetical protein
MFVVDARIIAFLPLLFLIGCGGSGNTELVETPYDQISVTYSLLARDNDIANLTPENNLPQGPDAGSAAYSGYVLLSVANAPISGIAGDIQINVDFETTSVSGNASGFHANDGAGLTVVDANAVPLLTNQIPFTGGFNIANRPDYPIGFDLMGNLMTNDGTVIGIDVAMNGDFIGTYANAVGGIAAGEASVDDAIAGPVVGTFLAVQEAAANPMF